MVLHLKGDIISDVSSLNVTFPVTFYSWKASTSFYFVKFCEGKLFSEVLDEDYRASNNFNGVPLLYEPKSISGIYLESAILIVSTKTLCFRSKATSCLP